MARSVFLSLLYSMFGAAALNHGLLTAPITSRAASHLRRSAPVVSARNACGILPKRQVVMKQQAEEEKQDAAGFVQSLVVKGAALAVIYLILAQILPTPPQ